MNKFKNSELLDELINESKKLGNLTFVPFTAERFIVAVINKLDEIPVKFRTDELQATGFILTKVFKDLDLLKNDLMKYINNDVNTFFLDDLYMKKMMRSINASMEEDGLEVLDCVMLLFSILVDPSEKIRSLINQVYDPKAEGISFEDFCEKLVEEIDFSYYSAADEEEVDEDSIFDMGDGNDGFGDTADSLEADEEDTDTTLVGRSFDELLDMFLKTCEETDGGANESEHPKSEEKPIKTPKTELAELVTDVKRIRTELKNCVYGQDHAINVFAAGYFQARLLDMTDKARIRPAATFLFAGPPGVGKTLLAEQAAKCLGLPFMRFDMSEYADKEANLEFCGSDSVYKNSKPGNVTSFVAENPKCVLLFDEIEKAHICVIHLFLQMLDAGRLRDNYDDKEVSFRDAVIILTTNAGKQLYEDSESGDLSSVSRKVIINALSRDVDPRTQVPYFPGAMCSRFASGNVVMFNHISAQNLCAIAKKEMLRHADNLKREIGIEVEADEKVFAALLFSEGASVDARTIRSRAESFFNDELYELLRLVTSAKSNAEIEDIKKILITVDLESAKPEIINLFDAPEETSVLILSDENNADLFSKKVRGVKCFSAQSCESAVEKIKNESIDLVLLDMRFGATLEEYLGLNIEDADTPAREFLEFLRTHRSELPIYALEDTETLLTDEEKISFINKGVRGVIDLSESEDELSSRISTLASALYRQASMKSLARQNKLVAFGTAQTVSKEGLAEIRLYDFRMDVAIDSEDSKNLLSSLSKPNVHFNEIIGAGDAKMELSEFINYLKNPKKYAGTGLRPPKGILLYGPPGTGKTMLAKAMACEADMTFIAAEGNQFLKKFVGEGSDMVHKLFRTARKYAPAILFVDEIEAIAKERRGAEPNGSSSGEDVLTSFLTEMDGFSTDATKPVFVIAATNFDVTPGTPKSLDGALLRRFDRRIYIGLPAKADRIEFLKNKRSQNRALDITDAAIENLAVRSTGMSLASLDSVIDFALRIAIREGRESVSDAILEEAFETFNYGEAKKWDVSELERTARHEAGHALLCYLGGETPSYLTIVARGNHGGYMQHGDNETKGIYTRDDLLARIRTSLGGRAAEIVCYGEEGGLSTGASGDLSSATATAMRIVCTYGMDDDFGLAVFDGAPTPEVRAAVNKILRGQMAEAVSLLRENKHKLDALVAELISKSSLTAAAIEKILAD